MSAATATATKPSTKPEIKYGTSTVDRFRGEGCEHANSHITEAAARRCATDAEGDLVKVKRFWGTKNGVRCECKFGHKTSDQALTCVGGKAKKTSPKTADPKPAASTKSLKSSSEGPGRA